jgi:hypothetical protein
MELSTAKTATIQGGKALVRTGGKDIAKEDWHVLVPYTLEEAAPAAQAAELAMAAAAATVDLVVAVCGAGTSAVDGGELLQRQVRIAAETAEQNAAEADQHVGYTEAAVALASDLHKVA